MTAPLRSGTIAGFQSVADGVGGGVLTASEDVGGESTGGQLVPLLWISNPNLALDHRNLREILVEEGVGYLRLFGSVLRQDFRPGGADPSDVDCLVRWLPERQNFDSWARLEDRLSEFFGRHAGLASVEGLLRRRNPYHILNLLAPRARHVDPDISRLWDIRVHVQEARASLAELAGGGRADTPLGRAALRDPTLAPRIGFQRLRFALYRTARLTESMRLRLGWVDWQRLAAAIDVPDIEETWPVTLGGLLDEAVAAAEVILPGDDPDVADIIEREIRIWERAMRIAGFGGGGG